MKVVWCLIVVFFAVAEAQFANLGLQAANSNSGWKFNGGGLGKRLWKSNNGHRLGLGVGSNGAGLGYQFKRRGHNLQVGTNVHRGGNWGAGAKYNWRSQNGRHNLAAQANFQRGMSRPNLGVSYKFR